MFTALKYDKGPFAIRYPKAEATPYNEEAAPEEIEVGKWEILNEGKDVSILAVGSMVALLACPNPGQFTASNNAQY